MTKTTVSKTMSKAAATLARLGHKKNPRSKEYYSRIGKLSHKKSPKSKEFYVNLLKKRWENKPKNKLKAEATAGVKP